MVGSHEAPNEGVDMRPTYCGLSSNLVEEDHVRLCKSVNIVTHERGLQLLTFQVFGNITNRNIRSVC